MDFDAIVIGSGFGGAVTACRLAEADYRVLVLERGRRWGPQPGYTPFPRTPTDEWLWLPECPEKHSGWLDLRLFPHMSVAQGAGVGGGSLIYANISCEAPKKIFRAPWPAEITYDTLKPHYDRVRTWMDVGEMPKDQWTARMQLMREAAGKLDMADRFRPLELAVSFRKDWTYAGHDHLGAEGSQPFTNQHGATQGTCVHLGNCDIGCDVLAKNTLDLNYLYVAEHKHHAEIRPLHLVTNIEPVAGGYRVHSDELAGGARRPRSDTARLVIVAAGSLGSTELLLRCRDIHKSLPNVSGRIGYNWSSNGDFLTPAIHYGREVLPNKGPTIASAIDFLDGSIDNCTFWIEDGGLPYLTVEYLRRKSDDPGLSFPVKMFLESIQHILRQSDPLRNVMPWFAQGVDAADGTMRLVRNPLTKEYCLYLDWNVKKSEATIQTIVRMHKRLALATGGVPLVPVTWSLFRDLVTPHPLGGCCMGDTAATGVVDHRGRVFGHDGLYVADAAIFPTAVGVNPSRTIAALAEHIAAVLVAEQR
jgi:cholesterol oxidase